ncbi:alpha-L-rhamnosidase [Wenxinia marina]|uniref:alpha-L-rhamnosidase n=1 Tax=Wenxinia marina DSM 24838 TaxID=1123501 RepID=A0A0D0QE62_9RHOB|nr:alpha-L-rhamnosidase [Wenxinia marina]KIQ69308.1 Alpha-L-rhamnosidase [Wenxinia marina DSM 24838]GGL72020.1 alpha-L-rhamnosidase [Wenxinia marina]
MSLDTAAAARTTASHEVAFDAKLIAPDPQPEREGPAARVGRAFDLAEVPKDARLRISALGLYRAFLNGRRVGDDYLTPGWTCYDDRIAYQDYDVADLLQAGTNRLDIWLGDGWYRGKLMWPPMPAVNTWGDTVAAIAELTAGGEVLVATEGDWESGTTPVTAQGIYHGEDADGGRAPTATGGVAVLDLTPTFVPHETGAVKALDPILPVESWQAGGATIHDFGQNAGAVVRLTVQGTKGATVRVSHSEILGPDRQFDNRNYRAARAEFRYTLGGDGAERWEPVFTFFGFRYARVEIEGDAEVTKIEMVPLTSVPDLAGGFECGVPEVNRLVLNTIWSQRSNFIEVPTDCPQRDERLGWTGDAQVFAGTACWLADCETFLKKYLRDVCHDQREDGAVPHFSPDPTRMIPVRTRTDWGGDGAEQVWAGSTGWGDVITIIPWQLYLHYGDVGVLEENFPAMLRWLDYLWSISDGPIIRPHAVWGQKGFTFGDWLQPVGDNRKPRPTIADDCAATIYHFISTELAARIAGILGRADEQARLTERAEEIRTAFGAEYFTSTGRIAHNDQTSWALAFLYGLVPDEHREAGRAYFRRVVEDAEHLIGTGFIGTPALLPALTKLGMTDLAEKVFLNRKVPGWLYQVERGATTIWERWDALGPDGTIYDPDMNSYNHYAYGAVCQWLFEEVAGVAPDPEAPGFDRVRLSPRILPALGHVTMWHECRHGRIEAAWRIEGGHVTYTVTLPEGCEGVAAEEIGGGTYGPGTHEIVFDAPEA